MMVNNPRIAHILPENSEIERLATGFQFTEGPVWNASGEFLLFSDIRANRIYKWSPTKGVTIFREPSGNSNGLTYDKEMQLIICEHSNRRLTRIEKDDTSTVLIERFRNKRLNSPNDVVVKSNGMIYFTDPPYGRSATTLGLSTQQIIKDFLTAMEKSLPKSGKVCIASPNSVGLGGIGVALGFNHVESHFYYVHKSLTREIAVFERT